MLFGDLGTLWCSHPCNTGGDIFNACVIFLMDTIERLAMSHELDLYVTTHKEHILNSPTNIYVLFAKNERK